MALASLRYIMTGKNRLILQRVYGKVVSRPYSNSNQPEKTALYDFHVKNNGKIVNFAGYLLPVQYSEMSIVASHLHTRKHASLFDVSHMLQTYIRGKDSIECFETLCPADIKNLKPHSGTLTVFTTDKGTIYDDLIVTKISSNCLYVVSNAAMKKQDIEIMQNAISSFKSKGKDVTAEFLSLSERSLLAVQGPTAVNSIQNLVPTQDLQNLFFMTTVESELAGVKGCRITRCGYTGEDGIEISVPSDRACEIAETVLNTGDKTTKLAGLGARDSLRLEAGLCLYGTDIDRTTTPIEAGLSWLIAKRRRIETNYPGADIINQQLKGQISTRRVGFRMTTSGPAARYGVDICINGEKIGRVTSGCPSPSIGANIGMGYVLEEHKKPGTEIQLKIRDKLYPGIIEKMPFVKTGYYLGAKGK
ncbi:unnamed protein product [Hermetia illucens]|uniref:Aminomethyltransferase n=1 Tax=Hermetia illucens TaxID=343691 RepID=A0A7R8V6N9_HERIL|nr:aminomethyltransferase, mitochondrial [Hermetia illucens]CAD7093905.1 unnamed protein product [Hermetia illucens]